MLQSSNLRRSLLAFALCSTAFAASATPAAARSHHASRRFAHAHDVGHHARRHFALHRLRHLARRSRWNESVATMHTRGLANAHASLGSPAPSGETTSGSSDLVMEARHYLGGNPTGRGSLWCARFMNMVLAHTGHRGTGSDMASSFASYGHRVRKSARSP
jgi:hypothetical protein